MKKFFTFIAIVAIAYFGITEYINNKDINLSPDNPDPTTEESTGDTMVGGFAEKAISNIFINILKTPQGQEAFTKIIQPMGMEESKGGEAFIIDMSNLNLIKSALKINTTGTEGSRKALCGQVVDIEYEIKDYSTGNIKKERKEIQLGQSEKDKAISSIIVGMYEGQTRSAQIPTTLLPSKYKEMNMPLELQITLHQIKSPDLVESENIKMFDDKLTYQMPYLCGEKVKLELKISSIDGKKVFESDIFNPIEYIVGDNESPVVFAYALFNKVKIGTRTVLTPGKYLNNFNGNTCNTEIYKYDPQDYYIMEFKVQPSR